MRRQVSCPYKGTGETLVLHAFIALLHIRLKDKILNRLTASISRFHLHLISSCKHLFLFVSFTNIWNTPYIFYGFNSYIYFVIVSYILLMRHENILHLIGIYLQTSSLIGNQYGFCFFQRSCFQNTSTEQISPFLSWNLLFDF